MVTAMRGLSLAAVCSLALAVSSARAQEGRIAAPELTGGTGWLGTDENITLQSLRGKIVIFDFWTLC